jgi:aurora kinase
LKELGKGKFGTVWMVRHKKTNFLCAMKIIKKSVVREERVEHQVAKEIRIHNALKHINIIAFYGYFHDEENFFILSEFATGGQVYSLLRKSHRLPENEVASIVKETADGLEMMHNLGFIHRDIKPENLILQFVKYILFRTQLKYAIWDGLLNAPALK